MTTSDVTPISTRQGCTAASHDLLRADVEAFKAATVGHHVWEELFMGHCAKCQSTLALPLCAACSNPCPSTDCLQFSKRETDLVAHAACMFRKALNRGRVTFPTKEVP